MSSGSGAGKLAVLTGATGFLGSHLAEALLDDGWLVRASFRAGSDRSWLDGRPVEWRESDLVNADDCRTLLHGAHTVIIAASGGRWVRDGRPTPPENWSIDFPDGSACHGFSAHPLGWL